MERKEYLEDKVPEAKPTIEAEDLVSIVREELLKASEHWIGLENTPENIERIKSELTQALQLALIKIKGTTPEDISQLLRTLRESDQWPLRMPQFPGWVDDNPFRERTIGPSRLSDTVYGPITFNDDNTTANPFRIIGRTTTGTGETYTATNTTAGTGGVAGYVAPGVSTRLTASDFGPLISDTMAAFERTYENASRDEDGSPD